MPRLDPLDWVVVALYGVVVVAIGAWANRRQKTTEDYFLGGRSMRWWAIGVSLIATSFSSAALIGGTGYGYGHGMGYLQLQIGDFVAILVACMVFLPFFARLRLTTAYEYLEQRFGVGARTAASALFLGQTLRAHRRPRAGPGGGARRGLGPRPRGRDRLERRGRPGLQRGRRHHGRRVDRPHPAVRGGVRRGRVRDRRVVRRGGRGWRGVVARALRRGGSTPCRPT